MARMSHCADTVESPTDDGAKTQASPSSNNGRDAAGKFTKGNAGGPGNPFARKVAELRRAALAATTPEKIAEVIRQLEAKALEGDVAAAKLYLSYTLGRPSAGVDPDTLDVQEAQQLLKEVSLLAGVTQSVLQPVLEALLEIVRISRPGVTQKFIDGLLAGFAAQDEAERAAAAAAQAAPPDGSRQDDTPCQEKNAGPSPNGASEEQAAPVSGSRTGGPPSTPRVDRSHPERLPITNVNYGAPEEPQGQPDHAAGAAVPRRKGAWVPPWEDLHGAKGGS